MKRPSCKKLALFLRARPGLPIVVEGLPSALIIEGVVNGRIDVGVVAAPFPARHLTVTNVRDTAVIVLSPSHRLAAKACIRADDLEGETIIMLTKFVNTKHPVEFVLQSVRIARQVETPLATIACVLAQEGVGLAIVDPFSASEYIGPRLVSRRFEPSALVGTAVIYSSERRLSAIAQDFHSELLAEVERFLARAV